MLALVLQLAADDPAVDPTSGRGPEFGKAAPVALLIILLMGVALFLLIRSMNSQLRKVPSAFLRGEADAPADRPAGADGAPAAPAASPGRQAEADPTPPADPGNTTRP
jgi:hypothetical protein